MEYLSPVINRVRNKLNTHVTLRLSGGRYSVPAKSVTELDFDIMSRANGSERVDLFNAIASKYLDVEVLILKDGKYVSAGNYSAYSNMPKRSVKAPVQNTQKTTEIAEKMGIKVTDKDESVVKETVKAESISKVTDVSESAPLDPVKAINNPNRKGTKKDVAKEEPKTALDNIKENNED